MLCEYLGISTVTSLCARIALQLRREFRSTFRDSAMESEKITSGRFHTGGTDPNQLPAISLDADIAKGLRVGLRDTITWAGQDVRTKPPLPGRRDVNETRVETTCFAVCACRSRSRSGVSNCRASRIRDAFR